MIKDCKHGHYSSQFIQVPSKSGGTKWFSGTSENKPIFKRYVSVLCPDCGKSINA